MVYDVGSLSLRLLETAWDACLLGFNTSLVMGVHRAS